MLKWKPISLNPVINFCLLLFLLLPIIIGFFSIFWMQIKISLQRSGAQGRTEMCAQSIVINYLKRIHVGILIVSLMLSSQMADNFIWYTEQFYVLLSKEKMYSQVRLNLCSLLLSKAKPFSFSPMLIRTSNVNIVPSGLAGKSSRHTGLWGGANTPGHKPHITIWTLREPLLGMSQVPFLW